MTKSKLLKRCYMLWRFAKFRIVNLMRRGYLIRKYLVNNTIAKLHLACGERIIKGWLNADLYVGDIYLNAKKRFPFKDGSFDYVYSHHFIEHISLKNFEKVLDEIYRVLKKGGRIRIVTPGLEEMINVYRNEEEKVIKHYCKDTLYVEGIEFFNQELRQDGEHKYTYDYSFIKKLLKQHGFILIMKYSYGKSDDSVFARIDDHGYKQIDRISLCVECEKK